MNLSLPLLMYQILWGNYRWRLMLLLLLFFLVVIVSVVSVLWKTDVYVLMDSRNIVYEVQLFYNHNNSILFYTWLIWGFQWIISRTVQFVHTAVFANYNRNVLLELFNWKKILSMITASNICSIIFQFWMK